MTTGLYSEDFRLRREIDRFTSYPNKAIFDKVPGRYVCGTDFVFLATPSAARIFAGNSDRGYEILVYDLDGRPIRKIRKQYNPVPVSMDYQKEILKRYTSSMPEFAAKIYFPANWHPFQSFIPDDQGRLFVVTYEPGKAPGEFLWDIFDSDGAFIGRMSLSVARPRFGQMLARIRGDRLYAVQEKPSGFKRLTVYRMIWK